MPMAGINSATADPAAVVVSAAGFSQANSLQESEALVSLLRNPRTFAKVVDILGHNIYCYHAHLNVRSQHAERNRR